MWIVNAEVEGKTGLAVRVRDGRTTEIALGPVPATNEATLDAKGGALLPGLHDHHIHLPALARARCSVSCGPPHVANSGQLRQVLRDAPGAGWVRGVGYHESVAGVLDRQSLDALCANRPVRIQHRSGKMWFLNSEATRRLRLDSPDGRLFRQDEQLRERLAEEFDLGSALADTSRLLASYGVTSVTETTPSNNRASAAWYRGLGLPLHVNLMGDETLDDGCLKIMLDDAELPTFDAMRRRIAQAHRRLRPVAIHCVTRTELVFSLAALRETGTIRGDRIEHAAVVDPASLALLHDTPAEAGDLSVVTQPNFIAERGDQYLSDVPAAEHDHLYRCRVYLDAGIPLGGGTDAPFGDADPWAAMHAAVHRRTASGVVIGRAEKLTPEQALALFTTPLHAPGGSPRRVRVGEKADLCLLDQPWAAARSDLSRHRVAATFLGGEPTFRRTG